MTSQQYEELCRLFIAEAYRLDPGQIHSGILENPQRPGLPEYAHQIDLYWESETLAARYLHIANAKWHNPGIAVQLCDVLLLLQIKQKLGANKAILLTNTGFSEGVIAAALDERVGLYGVRPEFNADLLTTSQPGQCRRQLQELARRTRHRSLYSFQFINKGLSEPTSEAAPRVAPAPLPPPLTTGRPANTPTAPLPGYNTRQGPGRGFRTK